MPMPCSDHAVLLNATVQHGRRETACGLPARVRLLPAEFHEDCYQKHANLPHNDPYYDLKSGSSTLQKKKTIC